jgi:hypothetical protein
MTAYPDQANTQGPRFDSKAERDKLVVSTPALTKGGFAALVSEDRGHGGRPIYDSTNRYGDAGAFATQAEARRHATRWIDGRIAQLERIELLRTIRQAQLTERLETNFERQTTLELAIAGFKAHIKRHRQEIERLRRDAAALVHEAASPQVELDFGVDAIQARVTDAPSVTDGTAEADPRQTTLDLQPPEAPPAEAEALERTEPPANEPSAIADGSTDRASMPDEGAPVRRKSNRRVGVVVERDSATARARVRFGSRQVWCKTSDLEAIDPATDSEGGGDLGLVVVPGLDPQRIHWPDEGAR